jgi:hypothetical protein
VLSEFEKMREQARKRFRIARLMVMAWTALVAVMVLYGIYIVGDLLNHPDKIGRFAGQVVSGYEEASK